MDVLILMGSAGSGKSTVGRLVASQLDWHYLSTGDIARKRIDGIWQELGMMAPEEDMRRAFDEEMMDLFNRGISQVVLDGMPRRVEQLEYIEDWFRAQYYYVIDVKPEVAKDRLYGRGRSDDTEVAINRRLKDYKRHSTKILDKVRGKHQITIIDANSRDVQQIADIIAHRFITEGEDN